MRTYRAFDANGEDGVLAERRLIPLNEAAARLGISKMTMARLVKEGRFAVYGNPLDRRQKLVDAAEVEIAVEPRPFPLRTSEPDTKKWAA